MGMQSQPIVRSQVLTAQEISDKENGVKRMGAGDTRRRQPLQNNVYN